METIKNYRNENCSQNFKYEFMYTKNKRTQNI